MEEIKAPKKDRKFLKAIGDIGIALLRELVLGIGKKIINKVGNKRQGLVIAFALIASISYASIDSIPYPVTGNKQRLGFQTTGNGLVYRGRSQDTITKPSSYLDKNVKAYLLLDSVRGTIFVWRQTFWDSIKVGGVIMPFDSITFNTSKDGTVGVGEVEYNDTQGSLIQGLKGGFVTNVIGQQLHQRVNNKTGATLTKGMAVYLSGSQGNRITVAKALAVSDPTSANTFGIVAEQILDNASGYLITEGLLININTSALTEDSAVYLSPTVAGGLTSTKPQAPFHTVYIGVCVKTNAASGELFVKIRNGQELDELHDVRITSPTNKASLYYLSSEGIWRDTTAALLVSDTAAMLANYASKAYADTSGRFYARQEYRSVSSSTLTWTQTDTLVVNDTISLQVYRNGQILLPNQYTVPTKTTVIIAATSFKLGENYTVIFPRGGGGGGSGSGSLTSISGGTGITVSPNPITTTGTVSADLSILMELTDTSLLNLVNRFALKLNISDTASMLLPYAKKSYVDTAGRFYARQDFSNVTTSTLTWTQTDTLIPAGVNVVQVYRNGQILLPSQYTIPTKTSVIIAATSFKVGENYTVIFPKGGGGSGGGGSGSLTSITGGTGITVSPDPITTTGTVSADLTVLMELTDTSLLNLVSRFALKLNAADTASLSSRINAKGTVTSIAMGYGISSTQSPLTTTGTMRVDSATVYDFVRDSIVAVEIGGDTIKIIKQEYNNVTSDTLTFTILPKFPIQLRQFILLFRNGQLLLNDQYTVIDTNKLKVAASSYKLGENYTIVTVSGIGSVGSAQGNPVYPDPGIAVSTGTTWTTSVVNNSSNWNTAYTDRYKWDGGSTDLVAATGRTSLGGTTVGQSMFTLTNPSAVTFPRFNVDNTVTALSDVNFRTAIGAGTGNGNGTVTSVTASATSGNPLSINTTTTTPVIELLSATGARNGYLTSTDFTTFNNKFAFSDTTSLNLTSRFATKQNTLTLTTTGTSGAATLVGATLNIPNYTAGGGGLGTVTSVAMTVPSFLSIAGSPITTSGTLAVGLSGTALPLANGGTGGVTAADARTSLGGTTSGISLFTLTNSVSDKFIKVNSNNTITLLSASDTRTTIGAGTGSVTSVGMTVPTFLSVSGSPVTSSGTLGVTLSGSPLPVLNGGTGGANEVDARDQLGAACKSCNETLTGNKTFSGTVTLSSVSGTATSVIGRSSTGQVVGVTLGSGLTLSSGTLSATDASVSVSGIVNTTTQSFAGSKTFTGLVGMQKALQRPVEYITVSSASITTSNTWVIVNNAGTVTLTFPSAASSTGTEFHIKTITANAVNSATSNISPLAGGSASTSILPATAGKYVTLVSDGTNWVIMQSN